MPNTPTLRTERLLLRPWRAHDLSAFAALNADPRVMEFMPHPLTPGESDAFAARIAAHFDAHGYGLWAAELPGEAPFIGFIGLQWSTFDAHFTPALEVGFRLMHAHWGKGLAAEGGRAAVAWAFANTDITAIHSWTAVINLRSRRALEKIGLARVAGGDFDHPRLAQGHALRPHVLYRVGRADWKP
ncbi:MAG: GNAT family N-acetyltransferase [Planctomycetes bacterium]|nr:GNAT family N-acetyltransferase [Planctomycetota bacterium]